MDPLREALEAEWYNGNLDETAYDRLLAALAPDPLRVWKVTAEDGSAMHGGMGRWHVSRWRNVAGTLEPCRRGLHLCRRGDLVAWLGPVIWEAEADGELIAADDKVVAHRARVTRRLDTWTERTARLFAADCAEHVLHLAEPDAQETLRAVIRTVRAYADDEATDEEVVAAWEAARAAAGAAAGDAAGAAAWAAARAAAGAAAGAAARDAAWASAWEAAREAAGASAWASAWAAAGDAAAAAARAWQTERLMALLYPEGEPI